MALSIEVRDLLAILTQVETLTVVASVNATDEPEPTVFAPDERQRVPYEVSASDARVTVSAEAWF